MGLFWEMFLLVFLTGPGKTACLPRTMAMYSTVVTESITVGYYATAMSVIDSVAKYSIQFVLLVTKESNT